MNGLSLLDINFLIVALIVVASWRAINGFTVGLVEEVINLGSTLISLFIFCVAILAYVSFSKNDRHNIIMSLLVIFVASALSKLADLVFKPLKRMAKLPGISMINKLAGAVIGAAESVVILWILYAVIAWIDLGAFGAQIMSWTHANPWLTFFYEANPVANLVLGKTLGIL